MTSLLNWAPRRLQRALAASITHLCNLQCPTARPGPPRDGQGPPRAAGGSLCAVPGFGRAGGETRAGQSFASDILLTVAGSDQPGLAVSVADVAREEQRRGYLLARRCSFPRSAPVAPPDALRLLWRIVLRGSGLKPCEIKTLRCCGSSGREGLDRRSRVLNAAPTFLTQADAARVALRLR